MVLDCGVDGQRTEFYSSQNFLYSTLLVIKVKVKLYLCFN